MRRPVDRRAFLRGVAAGGAVAAAGTLGVRALLGEPEPWDEAAFPTPGSARVAVLPASRYDRPLEAIVVDGLAAIGANVAGRSVLLKPNLVEFDPGTVINTDPRLVAATVEALRLMGAAAVTVGEGPGHRRDVQDIITRSGLLEALGEVKAPFVDLNADAVRRVPLRSRYTTLGELWLPQTVLEADIVISMPKMKTHHWAGVTLSLKNLFGCLPGRVYGWPKNVLHWAGIQPSILDIAGAVRPRYAIVDGIVGMQGNGPIQGEPVEAGVLVFGDDPVATDVVTASLMGVDPASVPYLVEAGRFLGQSKRERILDVGENPAGFVRQFVPPPQAGGSLTSG